MGIIAPPAKPIGTTAGTVAAGNDNRIVGAAASIANIAALRAYPYAPLSASFVSTVAAYSTVGDAGGGRFAWSPTSTASDNGGTVIKPTGLSGAGRWLRIVEGRLTLRMFGAACNGTTDDTAIVTAALNAVSAMGGGVLETGPYRVLIDSGNITVPENVTFYGTDWTGDERFLVDYTATPFTLVINPAYGIYLARAGKLKGIICYRKGLTIPNSERTALDLVSTFSGVAVNVTSGGGAIENCGALGFAVGFQDIAHERPRFIDLWGDCTTLINIDNCHDIGRAKGCHAYPFLTSHQSWGSPPYTVTNVASNGSGLVRLTVTPSHPWVTGDILLVSGVVGATAANGRWAATVIDPTTVDLQGSTFSGTYTSGGIVYSTSWARHAAAYSVTNSEGFIFEDCFDFGHDVAFDLGAGAGWTQLIGCFVDNFLTAQDPTTIGVRINATAYGTMMVAGVISSAATNIQCDSTSSKPHSIIGTALNPANGYTIKANSGRLIFTGCGLQSGSVYVADALTRLTISGGDWGSTSFTYQTASNTSKVISPGLTAGTGSPGYGAITTTAPVSMTGTVTIGSGGGNNITFGARQHDLSIGTSTVVTGFTFVASGNSGGVVFKSSGTLASGTLTMPPIQATAQRFRFYSQNPITSITINPGAGSDAVLNAPTSLVAGQWYECWAERTGTQPYQWFIG